MHGQMQIYYNEFLELKLYNSFKKQQNILSHLNENDRSGLSFCNSPFSLKTQRSGEGSILGKEKQHMQKGITGEVT